MSRVLLGNRLQAVQGGAGFEGLQNLWFIREMRRWGYEEKDMTLQSEKNSGKQSHVYQYPLS